MDMTANRFRNRHDAHGLVWKFDGGPNDDTWTWWCVQGESGMMIRRSQRTFPSFMECVLDAVKHRVADHQRVRDHMR